MHEEFTDRPVADPYEPPMLVEVGDYTELTRSGSGFFGDSNSWWGH